jgi:hypothetical protein
MFIQRYIDINAHRNVYVYVLKAILNSKKKNEKKLDDKQYGRERERERERVGKIERVVLG